MNLNKVVKKLRPWFERNQRPTWEPIVEEADGSLTESKFSGMPFLPDGIWPKCQSCQQPLQLFVQLDLSQLPVGAPDFGNGLLQFFFCTNEREQACYIDWYGNPFAGCQVVRIVDPTGSAVLPEPPAIDDDFPAKRIVGWTQSVDYPSPAEHEQLGLHYENRSLKCPEVGVEAEISIDDYFEWAEEQTHRDCKLAGWPTWVQNVKYASCPICEKPMNVMVFQIACDANIPFMLADGGIGQIIQCPDHKNSLAFVWASG